MFAASGAFSALAGVLLSYSLGAASPVALADVLATAAAAAIVGGVSVVGGRGSPMGIAAGVLTLCILRSGLSAIGVEPAVHDLVTGFILIAIAFLDAPELFRRVDVLASRPRRAQGAGREAAMTEQPPSSYAFVPLPDRAPLKFPGGAHVALIFTINIEYWEPFRPGQKEPLFPGGPATIPHALPGDVLDTANWTWREYGQRVGIWRLMDVFDTMGVAPSCTCNGMILVERRRIIDAVKERGWELVPHNWAQNDLLTYYAHKPDEERAVIRRTLDKYQEVVGTAGEGVAVVGDPRHAAHAGVPQGVRPRRLLRLSQRRPALPDRHRPRADRLRALFERRQRLQHVRPRRRCPPATASTCSSCASTSSMPKAPAPAAS